MNLMTMTCDRRLRGAGAVRARRRRGPRARAGARAARRAAIEAELVSVPFKWYPKEEILPHAAAWRLLDLSESNGRPIDLVIASKFPTYFVRHPHKVAWLIHQYRAAYELCGTEYSDFSAHRIGRRPARPADRARHRDARRVPRDLHQRAQHRRAPDEVQRPRGRAAVPPAAARRRGCRRAPYGDYVLSVGRHRVGQAGRPARPRHGAWSIAPIRLVVAGDGTQRANVERAGRDARRGRSRHVPRRRPATIS